MLNVPNFTVLIDVNECEKGQINLYDKYAFCNNIKGSYSCHCKQGFVGDGFNCTCKKTKTAHVKAFLHFDDKLSLSVLKAFDLSVLLVYDITNDDDDYFYVMSIFMSEMLPRKLYFFHVILFNFTVKISHQSTWFLLNGTYHTSEIENRSATGFKGDKVFLSLGPDGTQNGTYFFRGSGDSHINFSDINLDIRGSITILCWLYIYENNTRILSFRCLFMVTHLVNTLKNANSNGQLLTGTLSEKALGWRFVGVYYNEAAAEAQLWIDGNKVNSTGLQQISSSMARIS